MASKIGSVGEFDVANPKEWSTWKLRLQAWLDVNEIQDGKKVNALIAVAGSGLVDLMISLCHPDAITDKSFDDLVKLVDDHYGAGRNEIAESYIFDCRAQNDSESVSEYIVALRKLSVHCNFGAQWNQRMRNRLVSGLKDSKIRNRLLSEGAQLTWEKAVEMSVAADVQNNYTASGQNSDSSISVQRVRQQMPPVYNSSTNSSTNKQKAKCYRCLGYNHPPHSCRFRDAICHNCKLKGHIRKACRNQQVHSIEERLDGNNQAEAFGLDNQPQQHASLQHQQQHYLEQHSLHQNRESNTVPTYYNQHQQQHSVGHNDCLLVRCVSEPNNRRIIIGLTIEGINIPMELDTGSCVTLITKTDYDKYFSNLPLEPCNIVFKSASDGDMHVFGKCKVSVRYCGQEHQLSLRVVHGQARLLGRDWLSVIKLDWAKIGAQIQNSNSVNSVTFDRNQAIEKLKENHREVFKKELGTLKGI